MWRGFMLLLVAVVAGLLVKSVLPDVARYLKIREM
jgi:hypothetical protein